MRRFSAPQPAKRSGFVLVLTLAMILIAVMLSARTANRSLTRTLQSIDAETQLQHRWETLSLQRALLSKASATFRRVDSKNPALPLWIDGRFRLSDREYRVRLSDESSKLNLNTLRKILTPEQSQQVLKGLISDWSSKPTTPSRLESWGQVFGSRPPTDIMNTTTSITCWGDGRLNIQRASDDSIRQLLEPMIGSSDVDALLRTRRERTSQPPPLRRPLPVPSAVQNLVTEESRCYSLWMLEPESGEASLDIREWLDRVNVVTSFRW